jgi:hypothetical protein
MSETLPATTSGLSELAKQFTILDPDAARRDRELVEENSGPQGIKVTDLDRIKVGTGGSLSLVAQGVDGEETLREVNAVVVGWMDRRLYWKVPYAERGKQRTAPDCFSNDSITGVGDPGGPCKDCPFSEFGTDPKGGRGQACKQVRHLMVLRPGQIVPEILVVPPTSLRNASHFFNRLSSRRIPYWGLVITMRLERVSNADGVDYARIVFSTGQHLNEVERANIIPYHEQMMQVMHQGGVDAKDYDAPPAPENDGMPAAGEFGTPIDD